MISIVQYSRNDNHGGNLLKRMKLSFYTNIYLLEKAQIKSELIMVDYNTPSHKPKLYEILDPPKTKFVKIKFIVVEEDFHKQFKDHDKIPMNNMVARNIGIRRSKGEFILSTGIDVIFSKELISRLEKLEKGVIYRVHRYDVNKNILNFDFDYEEILQFCENNIIDVHFNTNKGFFMNTQFPSLHTNNCGDFQLAHRDIWFNLRGYPELDLMGTHCDTLFEYMAVISGNKEIVFEEKLFHIDHDSRWLKPLYTHVLRCWRVLFLKMGYDVLKYKQDFYKIAKKISEDFNEKTVLDMINYKTLSDKEYKNLILKMIKNNKPIIFNNENWGAGAYSFLEVEV